MSSFDNPMTNANSILTNQKAYTIGGVPIMFPYKAYPSQITMMDKIIKCLNKKHNCLLESPTGSGKSLALLCSALAWLKKTEKQIQENEQLLEQHLNAHGVVDFVPLGEKHLPSKIDIEKYKFGSKHNTFIGTRTDVLEENPESDKAESKYFSPQKCNDGNHSKFSVETTGDVIKSKYFGGNKCSDRRSFSSADFCGMTSLNDSSCENSCKISSAAVDDKKRGVIFIDDDDDDDFQPIKKSKIFSPRQSLSTSIEEESPVSLYCSDEPKLKVSTKTFTPEVKKVLDSESSNTVPNKLPKIYFGTRTHKQIGQIIRELKKTPYKNVKMTILSSRERTCIHPVNCKAKNKNDGCNELINRENGQICDFYKNLKKIYSRPPEMDTAYDLEDFISVCKRKRICPYYGARELLQASEIIFCPYNYLVDPLIRSALNITLKGNIIIMDEAHNIEDSAREAANQAISLDQLQDTLSDVLQICQSKDNEESEPYKHIGKVLENLKKWLASQHNLNEYVSFDSSAKVYTGDEMIAVLNYVGLGPDTFPIFQNNYGKISKEENESDKTITEDFRDLKLSGSTHMCLKGLTETLNYMFKNNLVFIPDFRLVVKKCKLSSDDSNIMSASQSRKNHFSNTSGNEITLNFWCLNPAVVFSDMKDVVHSLIVASGTLSPLTSFQTELDIPFQITLEANHVISRENLWIGTVGRGPSNNCLTGTYHNATTFSYQDDIGNVVFEVCSVIPYGVLCFLPSYGMLDNLVRRWTLTGLWDKLCSKKVTLCEPRRANEDFQQIIKEFYEAVKDSEEGLLNSGCNGAILFAVCRGKVSEGLDFADNYARAVVTIGIPFPNIKDAQVDLKKRYNDAFSSKKSIVTGSQWYEMQAFRALNQALGRCIRHRNDFGALIIVDERFQKMDRYIKSLSKWIRQNVEHFPTFCDAMNSLCKFAERVGLRPLKDNIKEDE